MSFKFYLREQLKKHPSMQAQDIVKMCYQAAHGAEHLLLNADTAKSYLEKEYSFVSASDGELYEMISDEVCRVNLAVWKYRGLSLDFLFDMFADSCKISENGDEMLNKYLSEANDVIKENKNISHSEWNDFINEYKKQGMPAVHHSTAYRDSEKPAYRIIKSEFLKERFEK